MLVYTIAYHRHTNAMIHTVIMMQRLNLYLWEKAHKMKLHIIHRKLRNRIKAMIKLIEHWNSETSKQPKRLWGRWEDWNIETLKHKHDEDMDRFHFIIL